MTRKELKEEVEIELELINSTVQELLNLHTDLTGREPTVREKTAAAAFLAQFYTGIENILKRISYFYSIPMPTGETWHVNLFKRFCEPPYIQMPVLFSKDMELLMASFRKFRHVIHHGYGFQLDWSRLQDGQK
jgi:hypothetical protein